VPISTFILLLLEPMTIYKSASLMSFYKKKIIFTSLLAGKNTGFENQVYLPVIFFFQNAIFVVDFSKP